ncbi:MAG: O-antigen ligase family protein [Microbacterium sp.]|uniref:O-antigen ligase family protein n=1 Tax=Microbacterium sp. TaxID=51671 RepID=UPI003F7F56AC
MTLLLTIVAASLLLAIVFRHRPAVWLSVAAAAMVILPKVATREWLSSAGVFSTLHPSVWLFLAGTVVTLLSTTAPPLGRTSRHTFAVLLVTWVVVSTILITLVWGSPSSFLLQYAAPIAAFFAVTVSVSRVGKHVWRQLTSFVLFLATFEAILAMLQKATGSVLLFEQYYATFYWWSSALNRSIGTLDSPLDLAAFLTMALPLVAAVRRTPLAVIVSIVIAGGVFVSGSRVGIVAAVAVLAWVLITHSRNAVTGIFIAAVLGATTILFMTSTLATELLDRFGDRGTASSDAREGAFGVGIQLVTDNLLTGNGPGFSYGYSLENLSSSFENAYLATAIDYGTVFVVTLLALQVWAVLLGRSAGVTYLLPGSIGIVWGFAYSSFLSTSAFGLMAWFFIGVSSVAGLAADSRLRKRTPDLLLKEQ